MSFAIGSILLIVAFVGLAILVVGVPFLMAMAAYDVVASRRERPLGAEDTRMRIAIERGVARAFVIGGGIFWAIAVFAGLRFYRETGLVTSLLASFVPLVAVLATLIIGWYYERITAALLMIASLAVIAWGVIYQFEVGVWILMGFALIGPMMTASVLFWLARQRQEAFELRLALDPDLSTMTAPKAL